MICKSHVTANMHHGTWGLMQSQFLAHFIEDPTHHIVMSRPLGATNCSCQQFKVQKLLIHYIEGSTAQLVKHKALNLVDVDSSPMMGVTSYDVIFIEVYIKVPAQYYLTEPALGGYTLLFKVYMIIFTKSLLIIA